MITVNMQDDFRRLEAEICRVTGYFRIIGVCYVLLIAFVYVSLTY